MENIRNITGRIHRICCLMDTYIHMAEDLCERGCFVPIWEVMFHCSVSYPCLIPMFVQCFGGHVLHPDFLVGHVLELLVYSDVSSKWCCAVAL